MDSIIRTKRLEKGLTQDQLSALTGIPQTTISAVETVTKHPTLPILLPLSRFFGCSVEDLIAEEEIA